MAEKYWVIAEIQTLSGVHCFLSHKKMTKQEADALRDKYQPVCMNIPEFGVGFDANIIFGICRTTTTRENAEALCNKMNEGLEKGFGIWSSLLGEERKTT